MEGVAFFLIGIYAAEDYYYDVRVTECDVEVFALVLDKLFCLLFLFNDSLEFSFFGFFLILSSAFLVFFLHSLAFSLHIMVVSCCKVCWEQVMRVVDVFAEV